MTGRLGVDLTLGFVAMRAGFFARGSHCDLPRHPFASLGFRSDVELYCYLGEYPDCRGLCKCVRSFESNRVVDSMAACTLQGSTKVIS